jgi:SAM-dependent methyltransferase
MTLDARVAWLARRFAGARTVLELGPWEGAHTVQLARLPGVEHVTAVEGRPANARATRARLLREGVTTAAVYEADLETCDLALLGRFDAAFCVGVLYHLPEPWRLLRQLAGVAPRLLLWTHHCTRDDTVVLGYRGHWYREQGLDDPLSGLSPRSFWPTRSDLFAMLADAGWGAAEVLAEDWANDAPALTLAAERTGPA